MQLLVPRGSICREALTRVSNAPTTPSKSARDTCLVCQQCDTRNARKNRKNKLTAQICQADFHGRSPRPPAPIHRRRSPSTWQSRPCDGSWPQGSASAPAPQLASGPSVAAPSASPSSQSPSYDFPARVLECSTLRVRPRPTRLREARLSAFVEARRACDSLGDADSRPGTQRRA